MPRTLGQNWGKIVEFLLDKVAFSARLGKQVL